MSKTDVNNKNTYEKLTVVELYMTEVNLQAAEETIAGILKDELKHMRMLDIGVGAGRTTRYFLPRVKTYRAIDYSENMISACRKKFDESGAETLFHVCDARDLTIFKDRSFDFILYSYNGLDYMTHEDRPMALKEIRRVGTAGGYLCFSTHNVQCISRYLTNNLCLNPLRLARITQRARQVKKIIRTHKGLSRVPYASFRDGGEEFQAETYYIKPTRQVQQLEGMGFRDIRIFSEKTGREISFRSELDGLKDDRWLYYLCRI